jgi:hypothetical protein
MARFRLATAHALEFGAQRTLIYCEPGREIDTAEMPGHFVPSPLMEPLDHEAETMWRDAIDHIRRAHPGARLCAVPVIGPMHHLPGGDLYRPKG